MAFDETLLVVSADSLGNLVSTGGVALAQVLTSDNSPGASPGLTTPGPSAGRIAVYYVSSDGDIGVMIAPAPLKEAAYTGSVTVTSAGTATQINQRCEKFSGSGLVTGAGVARVLDSRVQTGAVTVTTAGAAAQVNQRCEIFSGSGLVTSASAVSASVARVQTGTAAPVTGGGASCTCARVSSTSWLVTTASAAAEVVAALPVGGGSAVLGGTSGKIVGFNAVGFPPQADPLMPAAGVDGTSIVDASGSSLVWACTPDGDLCLVDSSGLMALDGVGSDFDVQFVSQRNAASQISGAASFVSTTHAETLASSGGVASSGTADVLSHSSLIFSGSGLVTGAGVATQVNQRCEIFSGSGIAVTDGQVGLLRGACPAGSGTATTSGTETLSCTRAQQGSATVFTSGGASAAVSALMNGVAASGNALSVIDDQVVDSRGTIMVWACTPDGDLCLVDSSGMMAFDGVGADSDVQLVSQRDGSLLVTGFADSRKIQQAQVASDGGVTIYGDGVFACQKKHSGSGVASTAGIVSVLQGVLHYGSGSAETLGGAAVEYGGPPRTCTHIASGGVLLSGDAADYQGDLSLLRRVQAGRHVSLVSAEPHNRVGLADSVRSCRVNTRTRQAEAVFPRGRATQAERRGSRTTSVLAMAIRTVDVDARKSRLTVVCKDERTGAAEQRHPTVTLPVESRVTYASAA